jgi:phage baseplate assembly protein W
MRSQRQKTYTFLGRGWGFPIQPGTASRQIDYVQGADKVRQSIWLILETEPGERLMRPDFGCGLRQYLMKPNTSATRALIQRDVTRALGSWEPRIVLEQVRVTAGDDPAAVFIHIHYVHKRDGSPASLVYPFYLE